MCPGEYVRIISRTARSPTAICCRSSGLKLVYTIVIRLVTVLVGQVPFPWTARSLGHFEVIPPILGHNLGPVCVKSCVPKRVAIDIVLEISVVAKCSASLTFNNSTFCPHSVFVCFVWISEQTAIISLYSINWLVCITEKECVYCGVRTEFLTL